MPLRISIALETLLDVVTRRRVAHFGHTGGHGLRRVHGPNAGMAKKQRMLRQRRSHGVYDRFDKVRVSGHLGKQRPLGEDYPAFNFPKIRYAYKRPLCTCSDIDQHGVVGSL